LILARSRARMRRRVRLWLERFGKLLPHRTERDLFSRSVRYFERINFAGQPVDLVPDAAGRERAAALLARHLTSAQRRCLRKRGFFLVVGKSGRRFRIWARRSLPVELIGSASMRRYGGPRLYCITTDVSDEGGILPLADYLLELKLCLEADEEYFLLTSNPNFEEGRLEKNQILLRRRGVG
jgi:hypothetical protein